MSARQFIETLRTVPAPIHGKRRYWKLAPGRLLLDEEEVKALRAEAKNYGIQPLDVSVRYLHETMARPMHLIELREQQWLADARTGQLYSFDSLQCQTDPLMQVEGLSA